MESRTKAIIKLNHLVDNYKLIYAKQPDNCKLALVLKADAYGHGAVECARALEGVGADFFAVASIEEAIELRNSDIGGDILIFGWTPIEELKSVEKYNLIQTLIDMNYCKEASKFLDKHNMKIRAHIKLDSGMSRLGWLCYGDKYDESMNQVIKIYNSSNINVEGIYTHFSSLYDNDMESNIYSDLQYRRFITFINELKNNKINPGICHCNNSIGTLNNPEYSMDMNRVGTALFGIIPKKSIKSHWKLKPVMNWKASIAMIKELDSNIPISYSRKSTTLRPTRLAVITVGYADGYSRKLSNSGEVGIRGHLCPIKGRVCMDMMLVDITDYDDISVGDEVILSGQDEMNDIPCESLWKKLGTGPSDITCSITSRVKRIYENMEV